MKKLLLTATALACAATCTLAFAACGEDGADKTPEAGHTHTYADAWTYDDNYHWHGATCDHTEEISGKAAHDFTNGDCVCGKTVPAAEIVLTENTDYSALVGEKVTEDGWKAAFAASANARAVAESAYDNVTVKHVYKHNEDSISYWKKSGAGLASCLYFDSETDSVIPVEFVRDTGDKITHIVFTEHGDTVGYFGAEYGKDDPSAEELVELFGTRIMSYNIWACPDFSEYFNLFEYDEELKAYTYDNKGCGEGILTNDIFYDSDSYWQFATVKIINGKLAFVNAGDYEYDRVQIEPPKFDEETGTIMISPPVYADVIKTPLTKDNDIDIFFYDFGVTEITVPDYTLLDPSEME